MPRPRLQLNGLHPSDFAFHNHAVSLERVRGRASQHGARAHVELGSAARARNSLSLRASDVVEESAIACCEFSINVPSQFLIDVSDDEAPSRTLASYDRATLVAVTKNSFSNKSGEELSQIRAMLGLYFTKPDVVRRKQLFPHSGESP